MENASPHADLPERSRDANEVAAWLEQYGDQLFAYARSRVPTDEDAEELVQETFVAAFQNRNQFEERSAVGTWLTAILRNKLMDRYRRKSKQAIAGSETLLDQLTFDDQGIWKITLGAWPKRPDRDLENQEFWQVFQRCLEKLPGNLAEVFVLRVLDGVSTEKLCKMLKVSPTNLGVRLHRARMALRHCLGKNWFGEDGLE